MPSAPSLRLLVAALALLSTGCATDTSSPWTTGLYFSIAALGIGGLSAVIGLWVDRDPERPSSFAVAMTALISAAIFVGMAQSYLDEADLVEKRDDLERLSGMVLELSEATGDPGVQAVVDAQGLAGAKP